MSIDEAAGTGDAPLLEWANHADVYYDRRDMERASIGDRVVEFWVGLPWFDHGPFSYHYIPRHTLVAFQAMPIVQTDAPYVIPSLGGMAIWPSTPAFFYAFFAGTKDKRVWTFGWLLIDVTTGIIISKAIAKAWDLDWGTYEFPYQWNLIPFYILIGMAIWTGRHDKMILACWAAILPVALMLFTFAGTGFAQFGYKFSLDFMPFLFLLTIKGMGEELSWHQKALILASVIAKLWGVVWIYKFDQTQYLGLHWSGFYLPGKAVAKGQHEEAGGRATPPPPRLLSVVVPTRNEAATVRLLIDRLSEVLADVAANIIFVDDSDDETPAIIEEHGQASHLDVRVLHRLGKQRRGGLSTAVVEGIRAADGQYVCIIDADLQHPPELIVSLLEKAERTSSDIVIASRNVTGGSDAGMDGVTRKAISWGAKWLAKLLFWDRLHRTSDPLSGFFLVRRALVAETVLRPIGFKILLDILIRADPCSVEEIPLQFQKRAGGVSKATFSQGRDFLTHASILFWDLRFRGLYRRARRAVTGKSR